MSRWVSSPRSAACLALVVGAALSGCVTTQQPPRGFNNVAVLREMPAVETIAALPPELTINQLSAGGVSEKRDDWTDMSRTHSRATLEAMRHEGIVYLADLERREELADEIREVRALFELIDTNFMIFGLSPVGLPTARFDFSVGGIDRILDAAGADALLIVGGEDDIFTADRKALAVVSMVASAALTGSVVVPGSGKAHISAGLIARDGTILWWNFLGDTEIADLRTPDGVSTTVRRLLGSMPRVSGKRPPAPAVTPDS